MSDPSSPHHPGWLPKAEYDSIYRRVPRLCVEVVVATPEQGVLLLRRDIPPNIGTWHIPGGTVLFAEPVVDAVRRVARHELGLAVEPRGLLGYIEYPSHYRAGLDCPVGLAFSCALLADAVELADGAGWFTCLPDGLYTEQREFLLRTLGLAS